MHVGPGADQHPAAEGRTVAHRDEHARRRPRPPRPARPGTGSAGTCAARPASPGCTGPSRWARSSGWRARSRSSRTRRTSRTGSAGWSRRRPRCDRRRTPCACRPGPPTTADSGLARPGRRVRGIVAGPQRDDPQGGIRADHRLQRLVDGAIPADRHDGCRGPRTIAQRKGACSAPSAGVALDDHDVSPRLASARRTPRA